MSVANLAYGDLISEDWVDSVATDVNANTTAVGTMSTTGAMVCRGATAGTYTAVPLGTTGLPLRAGATAPEYGTLDIAALSSALQAYLIPVGTITATIGATADTGYFLLDGSIVTNAQTLYAALWAKAPASWKLSAPNLQLPDVRGKFLKMNSGGVIGSTGGNNTPTIAETNLPAHHHTMSHNHTATQSEGGHTHTSGSLSAVADGSHVHTFSNNPTPGTTTGVVLASNAASTFALGGVGGGNSLVLHATSTGSGQVIDPAGSHTHSLTGTSAAGSGHTHGIDNFTGNTTDTGSGTPLDTTPANLVINYQIKS